MACCCAGRRSGVDAISIQQPHCQTRRWGFLFPETTRAATTIESHMKNDRIVIFDTTLRDGEQCPGAAMTPREKLEIARQLARLGVDIIEAGFPVSSEGDFASVHEIAREVKGPTICGLARCVPKDIEAAGHAVKPAGKKGRIHVFLGTSKLHREFKLGKAQSEILRL